MGIQIGNFFIPYYGMWIVLGLCVAVCLGWRLMSSFQLDLDNFILISCCTGLGSIIGAKILYLAVSWKNIDFSRLMEPTYWNQLMNGGFVFYGGLAGGLLGGICCPKIFKINIKEYINIGIPCIPVVHAFGRIGCYTVGCCYGVPYSGIGAVVYTNSVIAPNNISLFPVQIVEAALNLCIAGILLYYIYQKKSVRKNSLLIYLTLYAIIRFILEFFRFDDGERGIIFGISTSQWISLLLICGVFLYRRISKKYVPDL